MCLLTVGGLYTVMDAWKPQSNINYSEDLKLPHKMDDIRASTHVAPKPDRNLLCYSFYILLKIANGVE